jgi:hypothetical protein
MEFDLPSKSSRLIQLDQTDWSGDSAQSDHPIYAHIDGIIGTSDDIVIQWEKHILCWRKRKSWFFPLIPDNQNSIAVNLADSALELGRRLVKH